MRADTLTPEERERDRKHAELAALEIQLTERELELATLRAELYAFEARYLRSVGCLYVELDGIEARIAEALARRHPESHAAQEHVAHTRMQAQASAEEAGAAPASKVHDTFHPAATLKKLYREVARQLHPDLATHEDDRLRRHCFMAEVNRAYEDGDEARLQAVLREWHTGPESVTGEGVGADLVRLIRKSAQIEERLRTIEIERTRLQASPLFHLKVKVEAAAVHHHDLLATMAERVQEQVAQANARLSEVLQQRARL